MAELVDISTRQDRILSYHFHQVSMISKIDVLRDYEVTDVSIIAGEDGHVASSNKTRVVHLNFNEYERIRYVVGF